jgi:hypothetical protein
MLTVLVPALIVSSLVVLIGTFVANGILIARGLHHLSRVRTSRDALSSHPDDLGREGSYHSAPRRQLPSAAGESGSRWSESGPEEGPGGDAVIILVPFPVAPDHNLRSPSEWIE